MQKKTLKTNNQKHQQFPQNIGKTTQMIMV